MGKVGGGGRRMNMIEINWNPSRKDLRVFSALLIVFFGIVAMVVYRRADSPWIAAAVFGTAVVVGTIGLVVPQAARPIYVAWTVAVWPMGWTVSHLVLAAVYYGVMTPIGLLLRLFGHDAMQRKFQRDVPSYWHKRPPQRDVGDYFRQF